MQSDPSQGAQAAIRRAEAAVEALSPFFGAWLKEEVSALADACAAAANDEFSRESRQGIFLSAHTLKGQAATFGYPSIAEAAASLCRLLEHWQRSPELERLTMAHAEAIETIAAGQPENATRPEIFELLNRLRAKTADLLDDRPIWR